MEGEEASPEKEKEKELIKEQDEPVAFQILQKRRMSEVCQYSFKNCLLINELKLISYQNFLKVKLTELFKDIFDMSVMSV